MQVHLVRSGHAGCEPHCVQWIAAQGRIDGATAGQFRKALARLGDRKIPILIDSAGGLVNEALAIGRLIRAKGLDVVVSRTAFAPCAPGDMACRKSKTGGELRGLAQANPTKCASSCAFILAAGTRRFVGRGAHVGVHQVTTIRHKYKILTRHSFGVPVETRKTLVSTEKLSQNTAQTQSTYDNLRRYFAEMGIGEAIMGLILSTPGEGSRWLTREELKSVGLATHTINGEELVTGSLTKAAKPNTLDSSGSCTQIGGWVVGCGENAAPGGGPAPYVPADFLPKQMRDQPAQPAAAADPPAAEAGASAGAK